MTDDDRIVPVRGVALGRLSARPRGMVAPAAPGLHRVGPDGAALLLVPHVLPGQPVPLVLALHGAASSADRARSRLRGLPQELGFVALAPAAHGRTWDLIEGGFGPDVEAIDAALDEAFASVDVDAGRVLVEGFSDGASYALAIGLRNGDLFSAVVAFSPGFAAAGRPVGRPRIFVTHGTDDPVLPIDRCSRRLVPRLRRDGYAVDYREFEGGHETPPELAREALAAALA
jgi:phospholipase/carboxylesterase